MKEMKFRTKANEEDDEGVEDVDIGREGLEANKGKEDEVGYSIAKEHASS